MKECLAVLVIFMFSFFTISAPGMVQDYLIENFDKSSGLSNNNVKAILQDSEGYIWIGTRSGLDRYDGYHFEHIAICEGEENSRIAVYSLWQDAYSRIWIATSRGLYYYEMFSGKSFRFDTSFNSINYITGTSDDKLWAVSQSGELCCISLSDLSCEKLSVKCKFLTYDSSNDKLYLVSNTDGLYIRRNGSNEFEKYSGEFQNILSSGKIYSLTSAAGRLFVGTLDGNVIYDVSTGQYSRNSWPLINQAIQVPSDDVWVATKRGVYVLDSRMNVKYRYFKDSGTGNSIIDNYTISIACDRNSGIWIGTYFAGLSHLVPNKAGLCHYFPGQNVSGGCNVREIVQDTYSNTWIGTNADGLYRLSPDGNLKKYDIGVSCKNILGLFVDGDTLWIGLNSDYDPLLSLDVITGRVRRYDNIEAKAYDFCKSSDGRLWIGGEDKLYLCSIGNGNLKVDEVRDIRHIRRIIRDSAGRIWVASVSGVKMSLPSGNRQFNVADMPSGGYVSDVFEDSDGGVWVTTDGGELSLFNENEEKFHRVVIPSEYQCDKLFRISQDKEGYLWITTSSGLLAFKPGRQASMILVRNEDLSISNFNYSSNFHSPQGFLYAGTIDGFVSFNPKILLREKMDAGISLTSFIVPNTLGGESRSFPKSELRNGGRISLPASQNSFEIRVSDFDYSFPHTSVMMYRLDGFSEDWRKLTDGIIKVSSLQSGKYTLNIKHSDADEVQYSLSIEIKRPFVLSFPFFAILLAAVVLVVWLIIRKERRHAISVARKAAEEESRIREIENEKKLYASKVEFLSSIAHEIKTPLMLISMPIKSLRDKLSETKDDSLEDDIGIIDRNAERLLSLIDDLLDFGQMETAEYRLDPVELDVSDITRNVFDRFALSARKKKVDFTINMPQTPIIFGIDKAMYEKILGNLLSNALKYCRSYVIVNMEEKYGDFVLSVTNDGEIVPLQQRTNIFKPFVRYSGSSVNPVPGTGIGLYTSSNFASIMGGNLEMDDDLSVNRFVLYLPIMHLSAQAAAFTSYDVASDSLQTSDSTVMLVEDDFDARSFLIRQLEKSFNTINAGNGQEAIDMLKQGEMPDIIISDIVMPQVDGYELCKYVKSNIAISHIPVILLTAVTTKEAHLQGLDVGADAYLQKPVSVEILLTTIRNVLQNRKKLLDHFMNNPASSLAHSGLTNTDVLFLRHLQEYISEHLDNPDLKNKDVAGAMCVSSSALFKKVKALTGMSPMEYLQRARLNKAAEMLSSGEMSITNACYASGFNTPSYFAMVFKRRFGMTPREWVDKVNNK